MHKSLRDLARGAIHYGRDVFASANTDYRAVLLHAEYRARRKRYEEKARHLGIRYKDAEVDGRTATRLESLGLNPTTRPRGQIHTLAFFPLTGWHPQLLKPLAALGPVSHFDSRFFGVPHADLLAGKAAAVRHRQRICGSFERFAARALARQPVDWVFLYAMGSEILVETIDRVRKITGAPIVGMCFDDKQSWESVLVAGQNAGQISLAPHLDLAWTSARLACEWYMVEGGNPIYLPEGCDPDLYSPADCRQDLDVCFVGQAYGFRKPFIRDLRGLGVSVYAAGAGWPEGAVSDSGLVDVFRRSKIILGLGGIGWSQDLKNTKGRDFDAPTIGMAPYLTSYNPELAELFEIGREIVCFSNLDECYEATRRLLADEPLRVAIAKAGRARCLRQHTWQHRFERVLTALGIWEN